MISTFVSLAALVAGAPFSIDAAPAPVATPVTPPAAVIAPIAAPAPAPAPTPTTAPAVADATRPLPMITVQDEAAASADTPDASIATETESAPAAEVLAPVPVIPPAPTDAADTAPTPRDAPDLTPEEQARPIADPAFVSPTEQRAILKAAAGALGSVETARGRFSQLDPNGNRATGTFALRRPGRMRFDYDDPVPLLIAADGATVAVHDAELETVDRVPLAATPLNLLLDDRLDFETEAEVTRVLKANGQVAITMRDRSGEADGELTLLLDSASYDLMGWRTLDANDRFTYVDLVSVETGVSLNPGLFIIDEDEDEDEDDRR